MPDYLLFSVIHDACYYIGLLNCSLCDDVTAYLSLYLAIRVVCHLWLCHV